jgi:methionyl aminopeptidase
MFIKTKREIKFIKEGGKLMGEILSKLQKLTKPGMSLYDVDVLAEKMILEVGGKPAFKGYKTHFAKTAFPSTICASVNTELVHGIARKDVVLKEGDIFSIDIGMEWPKLNFKSKISKSKSAKDRNEDTFLRGYFTDTAITFAVGKIPDETKKLLAVTKEALEQGIKAAVPGNSVAAIGKAVEKYVRRQGDYGIVRDLVGHGVGHEVHEEPSIPNYYDASLESIILKPGMVIAIEPMLSLSKEYRVRTKADGWTIEMVDKSLCAHFEHTLVITEKGNVVVTRRPGEGREVLW